MKEGKRPSNTKISKTNAASAIGGKTGEKHPTVVARKLGVTLPGSPSARKDSALVAGIGRAAIDQQIAVNQDLREDLLRQVEATRN